MLETTPTAWLCLQPVRPVDAQWLKVMLMFLCTLPSNALRNDSGLCSSPRISLPMLLARLDHLLLAVPAAHLLKQNVDDPNAFHAWGLVRLRAGAALHGILTQ